MITTRNATFEDLPALVEVNKSDVDEWYHWTRMGRGEEARYDALSGWERQMHGGPWLHLGALQRYWDFMKKLDTICILAELDGNIVGHLDVIPTGDRDLGRYLFLDVLMVHSGYRRQGIATALLKAVEDIANEFSLPKIIVMTEYDGAGGLTYRKNNYSIDREMYTMISEVKNPEVPPDATLSNPINTPPLDSHHMVCGWWNTPSKNWMDSFHPGEIKQHLDWHQILLTVNTGSGSVYLQLKTGFPDRSEADICLWTPRYLENTDLVNTVEAAKCIAKLWGAERLTSIVLEEDRKIMEEAGFKVQRRRDPLLCKQIKQL